MYYKISILTLMIWVKKLKILPNEQQNNSEQSKGDNSHQNFRVVRDAVTH